MSYLKSLPPALLAALLAAISQAQAQAPTELPPIMIAPPKVQGATLERAPVAKSAEPAAVAAPATPSNAAAAPAQDSIAGVPADTIGTQVSVVTGADLRQQQVRHVPDALRALPGVQISSSGSTGSLTQIRIRGADGRHTRVLIDGIEANTTTNGEFDFSNLLAEDIERLEIIRGPMSGLYGAGALGGVINIITRAAKGPLSLLLRTEVGSFGTKDVTARLAAGNDTSYVALSGQWRQIDGFNIAPTGSETDATRLTNFALRAGVKLTATAQLDITLRHSDKRAQYDDFGAVISRTPFLTADDANNVLRDTSTLAGIALKWDAQGGALTQEIKGSYTSFSASNRFDPLICPFGPCVVNHTSDNGERVTGGYSVTYRFDTPAIGLKQAITGLVEARRETYTPFSDFGFGGDGDGLKRTRTQASAAAEWRGTFGDRLTVTAGARQDNNDNFQDFTTWRSSLSYAWRELGLRPHGSIGTGVKLPGMYDQFGPNTQDYKANPLLKPETSLGWDAGIEATLLNGRAVVDVTYFRSTLADKITGFGGFDPTDFKSFTTNDVGESIRRGVEVSSRYLLSPAISLGLAYTYTDARRPDGTPEFRRAPHSGRADVRNSFADGRGTASLAVSYNGQTPDRVFQPFYAATETFKLPHYWLVSAAVSYRLQPNLEIFGRVENALNSQHQEIYGYSAAGVAVYAGVKVTFDDFLGTAKR